MKKDKRKKSAHKKSAVREWFEVLLISVLIALFVRTFFVQAFKIPTGSMIPTLKPGDRILVNKLIYGPRVPLTGLKLPPLRKPRRGDVVVFIFDQTKAERNFKDLNKYLHDESKPAIVSVFDFLRDSSKKDYIKRLIGLPGDSIEIKNGDVYINGQLSDIPQIRKNTYFNDGRFAGRNQKIEVPKGHYFFLGDNSSSSLDSRYWGFVPEKLVIGRAILIHWPLNRLMFIR